ncbi:unnamed protein product [Phaeothamnion confervicola]
MIGKKAMRELGARHNDAAGSGYTDYAKKMMAKMGWSEGQGLGKDKQGVVSYIRVDKKDDVAGIGRDKAVRAEATDQWYFSACNSALAAFKALEGSGGGKKKRKAKKEGSKDSGSSGDGEAAAGAVGGGSSTHDIYAEMFRATGGARMGMRARGSQSAKWARCEDSLTLPSTGGLAATATASATVAAAGAAATATVMPAQSPRAGRATTAVVATAAKSVVAAQMPAAAEAAAVAVTNAAASLEEGDCGDASSANESASASLDGGVGNQPKIKKVGKRKRDGAAVAAVAVLGSDAGEAGSEAAVDAATAVKRARKQAKAAAAAAVNASAAAAATEGAASAPTDTPHAVVGGSAAEGAADDAAAGSTASETARRAKKEKRSAKKLLVGCGEADRRHRSSGGFNVKTVASADAVRA